MFFPVGGEQLRLPNLAAFLLELGNRGIDARLRTAALEQRLRLRMQTLLNGSQIRHARTSGEQDLTQITFPTGQSFSAAAQLVMIDAKSPRERDVVDSAKCLGQLRIVKQRDIVCLPERFRTPLSTNEF